jgi:hypothetical protein
VRERSRAIWEPTAEQRALLRAGLWQGERGLGAWREWRRRNPDIDAVDTSTHRLLPLVYRNLGPLLRGEPDAGRLKGIYRHCWAGNQLALKVGRRAIDRLLAAGLDVLVLKGGALIGSAYRDVGARPLGNDIDVAVRPESIGDAVATLEAASFEPAEPEPLRVLDVHHSLGFFDSEDHEIDLHRGMLWRTGLDEEFWRKAVPAEVGGARVLILCPSDQLLHVCVHGAGWNPVQPFRWVADSFKVLDAAGGELDWDRLVAMATRGHLTVPIHAALDYLAQEMGADVPPEVLRRLAEVPVSRRERRAHGALARPPSSRRSVAMLWWFWERQRAQASLDGSRAGPAGMVRYLQGFWGLDRPSQVPLHALRRLARRRADGAGAALSRRSPRRT